MSLSETIHERLEIFFEAFEPYRQINVLPTHRLNALPIGVADDTFLQEIWRRLIRQELGFGDMLHPQKPIMLTSLSTTMTMGELSGLIIGAARQDRKTRKGYLEALANVAEERLRKAIFANSSPDVQLNDPSDIDFSQPCSIYLSNHHQVNAALQYINSRLRKYILVPFDAIEFRHTVADAHKYLLETMWV